MFDREESDELVTSWSCRCPRICWSERIRRKRAASGLRWSPLLRSTAKNRNFIGTYTYADLDALIELLGHIRGVNPEQPGEDVRRLRTRVPFTCSNPTA